MGWASMIADEEIMGGDPPSVWRRRVSQLTALLDATERLHEMTGGGSGSRADLYGLRLEVAKTVGPATLALAEMASELGLPEGVKPMLNWDLILFPTNDVDTAAVVWGVRRALEVARQQLDRMEDATRR
jgi:hypothetical protein